MFNTMSFLDWGLCSFVCFFTVGLQFEVSFVLASTARNLILSAVQVWLCCLSACPLLVRGIENGTVYFTESQN